MCIVCADMSGQFRRTDFLPEDLGSDLAVGAGQRGLNFSPNSPLSYLDLDDRGGTAGNGKPSLTPTDAGTQITRANARWSANIGDPATVTYAFRSNAPAQMPSDTSGFSRFSEAQIAATELMLLAWSDVARITFNRVGTGSSGEGAYSDSAAMLFGNYSAGADGAAAFAYYPGNTNSAASSGDVWINSSLSYNATPLYLAYGYQVLVHEIGHAIGLGHPADYNAGSGGPITYSGSATYYEDTRQYTVMSYFGESNTGGNFGGRYSSAPLLDDIAAAQRLYGANMTTRAGDTVYGFNSTADRVWFNAGTSGSPQAVIFAVWDAGGTDTLDFSGYTQAGIIDLRQGHFSSVGGLVGNVSIAMGAVIENAIGGSGADVLVGNSANNRLTGGTGNDNLYGGAGSDTAVFSGNMSAYTITAGTETINGIAYRIVTVVGPDGTDVLRGIENLQFADQTIAAPVANAGVIIEGDATNDTLTGTDYADHLIGADGNDTIDGGLGDDEINGGRGNDNLTGGLGFDWVDYSNATGGVTVNLTSGTSSGAAGNDSLAGFEAIRGSTFNDTLTGNAAGEIIDGMGGSDTLNGEGGNDQLYARDGILVAAADVIKPNTQSNLSIGTAVNVDANFDLMNDSGVQNATTVPHAVIRGTGTGGGQEYYAFTVTAGAACIFDIASAGFDTTLRIFDASGTQLAWNDDEASGNTASLINYTFATAGTYYVAVGAWQSGASEAGGSAPVPNNGTYVLNVSIPGHSYVETTGVGSTLNGGDGDDVLYSGSSDDTINGGEGTDRVVLFGARSAWTITDNGGGSFTVSNGSQTDTLTGVEFAQFTDGTYALTTGPTENDDTLEGTVGDDTINALGGNDTVDGREGNDTLYGGAGGDILRGYHGNDRLYGEDGDDMLHGEDGDDLLVGWTGNDHLNGGNGIDVLYGEAGADILYGEDGNDQIHGGTENDLGFGGAGDDFLYGDDGDDELSGGDGIDYLYGGAGVDRLFGEAGNDFLYGNDGDDRLVGWTGNDYLNGGLGADVLYGEAGNDELLGGDGGDTLYGGADNDALNGEAGDDFLHGGDGDDLIGGSFGVDFIYGGAGIDRLYGESGNDYLYGEDGDDLLVGWIGNDYLNGGAGADRLYGEEGNDELHGGDGSDRLYGGLDNDALNGDGGDDFLYGQDGDDLIGGSFGIDFIYGGAGADRLYGEVGDDFVYGEDGDDLLVGWIGNDYLNGGAGADRLYGEDGNDELHGGDGDDRIYAGLDNDTVDGGAGDDFLYGQEGDDLMGGSFGTDFIYGGTGAARLYGEDGNDYVYGEDGDDLLVGWLGNDYLNGGAGADRLYGEAGNDELYGGDGNDRIYGGADNDTINAGAGNDQIWGEAGNDQFVFSGAHGNDIIYDFTAGAGLGDVIALTGFTSFAQVLSNTTDDGLGNTVINHGGNTITLMGVLKANLVADDFVFYAAAPGTEADGSDKQGGPLVLPGLVEDDPLVLPPATDASKWEFTPQVQPGLEDTLDPLVLPDIGDVSVKAADTPVICFVDEDIMEASLAAFNGKPHIERMADNDSGNWILV